MASTAKPLNQNNAIGSEKKIAFAALRHRDFRSYFVTTMLAMMADNIEHVISYWLLFEKFRSPVLAGFAVLSHWTPFLFFSVYFGAMADRYDCRKVIQVAQIMFMGVSAAWAFLFYTDTIEVWQACVLLVIHGMAGVLWSPGSQLLIHDIVGSEQLQSAVRLNSTSRQLGVLFGPAVGGGLMLLLGPSMGLVVNTLIYLPLTLWLLTVPYTGHSREHARPPRRSIGWKDAFEIVREVSGNRPIITMVVLAGCVSFFVGTAFQATMPEFAHDLGTEKADLAYSALLGANAAGAVIGGFLLEGRGWLPPRVSTAMISAILWCLAIAGFALSTSYYLSLLLLFTAGVLNLTFSSMGQTIVQLLAPPQLRGRLIGLFAMASLGLKAFSGVTVGVLGGLIGVHWSLALSAMVLLTITVALFAFTIPGRQQGEFS
ncbi:MAG TPA: MFS transporter [Candidatus Binatia bacterium]|nr:MFS transporter [Candidatus Binatia bacterium]